MKRTMRNGRGQLPVIAAITAAAVGVAALAQHPGLMHAAPLTADSLTFAAPVPSTGNVAKLEDLSDAFATVAARVKPSVVYITAKQAARPVSERSGGQDGGIDPRALPPELRDFFRNMPGMPGMPRAPRG